MKTVNNKNLLGAGVAIVIAMTAWLPANINAQDTGSARGGATKLLELNHIKTQAEVDALKPGDTIAMACAKCKTVMVERVEQMRGRQFMVPGTKHLCAGCGGHIEVVGQHRQKTDVVHHTCSKCGEDSAFCCATKPGEGATRGMEKEKK